MLFLGILFIYFVIDKINIFDVLGCILDVGELVGFEIGIIFFYREKLEYLRVFFELTCL